MEELDRNSMLAQITSRAEEVAEEAKELRMGLRWRVKRDDPERRDAIANMLEQIRLAMAPVKAEIGRIPWEPTPLRLEGALREASAALQVERKQLRKMR